MNQDRAKHLQPIIEHLADGGSIDDVQEQFKEDGWEYWDGVFTDGYTYRLKPQPIERWVNEYETGFADVLYNCKVKALRGRASDCTATRRVLIMPEGE
ncbi:MAG: DUF3105 domain-containing protein [Gammaproteobacteria bacterium]|nr:DUF3105 domain-containing protein [Gammaproteobacteria bacterium]